MSRIAEGLLRKLSAKAAFGALTEAELENPAWEKAGGRILILRLSSVDVVASSTSHLVLFAQCRKACPSAYIDFGFFPNRRDRELLLGQDSPCFYGLASGHGPEDFDLILVSNSFALELPNLSYLFSKDLPASASARGQVSQNNPKLPLIVLGGSNALSAGSLLLPGEGPEEAADSLVDAIFFGEGESAIREIAAAATRPGWSRDEKLAALASVEGLWLALSGRGAKRRVEKPHPEPLLRYPILNTDAAGTAKLQISAGCPGFCSFCLEGWVFRPYREIPLEEILKSAKELKRNSGASTLEVYSYNFNTHEKIFDLFFELGRLFRRVNFMSQRIDILASSPEMTRAEEIVDKRSYTLGIEGISERMRRFYRKGVTEEDILGAIRLLCRPSTRELKLFYILSGLETEEDLAEFTAFTATIEEIRKSKAGGARLLASAGYLVRLPFTPLQYAKLCLDSEHLKAIASAMGASCESLGIEFRLAADYDDYFADQILALGGRRLGPWIAEAAASGIAYDDSLSRGAVRSLEAFAQKAGIVDAGFGEAKALQWRPPLAFVDANHEALRHEYERAVGFSAKEGRLRIPAFPGPETLVRLEKLIKAKRAFTAVYVCLQFPPQLAQAAEEYRSAWILRRLFAAAPEALASVFEAEPGLFGKGMALEGFAEAYWGQACYRLIGPAAQKIRDAAVKAGFQSLETAPSPETIDIRLSVPVRLGETMKTALIDYLKAQHVGFIETKRAESRLLLPAEADRKKQVLVGAELINQADCLVVKAKLGRKASLTALTERLNFEDRKLLDIEILGWS